MTEPCREPSSGSPNPSPFWAGSGSAVPSVHRLAGAVRQVPPLGIGSPGAGWGGTFPETSTSAQPTYPSGAAPAPPKVSCCGPAGLSGKTRVPTRTQQAIRECPCLPWRQPPAGSAGPRRRPRRRSSRIAHAEPLVASTAQVIEIEALSRSAETGIIGLGRPNQ